MKKKELKQSVNVFLSEAHYRGLKKISYEQDIPYSELIRDGVAFVLRRYKNSGRTG